MVSIILSSRSCSSVCSFPSSLLAFVSSFLLLLPVASSSTFSSWYYRTLPGRNQRPGGNHNQRLPVRTSGTPRRAGMVLLGVVRTRESLRMVLRATRGGHLPTAGERSLRNQGILCCTDITP